MEHRHLFGTSQMFKTENDPSWNNTEQPYVHLGRACAAENSSSIYPENMSVDHFSSHWNSASRSNGHPSSTHNVEVQHHQLDASGPSQSTFMYPSGAEIFSVVTDNYAPHASSSNHGNYSGQTFDRVDGSLFDLTVGSRRGQYKRKSPSPAICERGSTSIYNEAGSSSDLSISSNLRWQKANTEMYQTPWECHTITPNCVGNALSIGDDGSLRNVRSRVALELETNLVRARLSNSSHFSYIISWSGDHLNTQDPLGQSSNSSTREWNHSFNASSAHDSTIFSHETNHSVIGTNNPSFSFDIGGYHNDFLSSRNCIPQNLQGTSTQSVRGLRSSNSQRSTPTFRASSSNLHPGPLAASDEGLQLVAESYTSRHLRPCSAAGWGNSKRNGRTRISHERFRSFPDEIGFHDQHTTEGLMIVDRAALYGPRNSFDQHSDMRLDLDNMSYEELLALGERIGNVSTGLSKDLMSKCLTQSIYCSSEQVQEEGTCVICLEEYKDMDDVGTLKTCRHDFHVGYIRKWLLMKNICPICNASALADHMKEK